MAIFIMFGSYTKESMKEMGAGRTTKAVDVIKKHKGKVKSMYALLGQQDLMLITDFPEAQQAMKASIALTRLTGILFSTSPAISVEEFDQLLVEV
jgi:uncharacterized protein with GYD domain